MSLCIFISCDISLANPFLFYIFASGLVSLQYNSEIILFCDFLLRIILLAMIEMIT